MRTHVLTADLWLPRRADDVFPFFADARNLEAITPQFLRFRVVTPGPVEMRAGAVIDYRLRLHAIPLRWRTEITAWEPGARFVDEQIRGPYRLWRHEHTFEPEAGAVRCRDRVEYAIPPPGWLGERLAHRVLVAPDLARIFAFRARALMERFGGGRPGPIVIDGRVVTPA